MSEPRDLARLQHWFQTVITDPRGVAAGIASEEARRGIDLPPAELTRVVTASPTQSAAQRMEVYAGAYFARLLDAMQELFPALARLLGEELFGQFGIAYLAAHPPRSYTLAHLADRFVEHLAETRPQGEDDDWSTIVVEIARLERTIDEVFDAPGEEESPSVLAEKLAAVPPERQPRLRLVPSASLRLLEFEFPVNELYTSLRREPDASTREILLPERAPSWLAIWRRDYVVRRLSLARDEHTLLTSLAAGQPLVDSLAAAAEVSDDPDLLLPRLGALFQTWGSARILIDLAS